LVNARRTRYRDGVSYRSRVPLLLASDEERDQQVLLLRDAVVGGRLTLEEFSDRVGQAQVARTNRELAELTADLPAGMPPMPGPPPERHTALCSRLVRRGPWELPGRSHWRSLFGTIELDLRRARLVGQEIELRVFNLFGTVSVIVPAGVEVAIEGGGWFSSQVFETSARRPPAGAPRLRIRTSGPGGTLYVRSSSRRGIARVLDKLDRLLA
jgi:hypothetical protein